MEETSKKLALFCKSFANASRVMIVQKIAEKKSCIREDLADVDALSSWTIDHHIVWLKKEGIIKGNISKRKMCYCIDWDKLDEFKALFDTLYTQVKTHQENVTCNNDNC